MIGTVLLLAFFLACGNIAVWALFSTLLFHPYSEERATLFTFSSLFALSSYIVLRQWGLSTFTLLGALGVSIIITGTLVLARKRHSASI
jgi:hypothetical protein